MTDSILLAVVGVFRGVSEVLPIASRPIYTARATSTLAAHDESAEVLEALLDPLVLSTFAGRGSVILAGNKCSRAFRLAFLVHDMSSALNNPPYG